MSIAILKNVWLIIYYDSIIIIIILVKDSRKAIADYFWEKSYSNSPAFNYNV